MYTLVERSLSNKITILDVKKDEFVRDLNKEDLKQEFQYFLNQSKDIPKVENKKLHLFYNEETGNLVFGKKIFTKKGLLNKKYLSNNFLRYKEDHIKEAKKILEKLTNELEDEGKL